MLPSLITSLLYYLVSLVDVLLGFDLCQCDFISASPFWICLPSLDVCSGYKPTSSFVWLVLLCLMSMSMSMSASGSSTSSCLLHKCNNLIRVPPGHLPLEVSQAHPTGRRPQGRSRDHLRNPQGELESICGESLLPPCPNPE